MADDTNTAERESFEAWASQSVGRVWRDTAPGRTEDYLDASTNLCWRAWQARASLAASAGSEPVAWPTMPLSLGQSPVLFEDGYAEGWAKCLAMCKAAFPHPSPPEGMAGWKPIETHPRHSDDVQLYCADTGEQFVGFLVQGNQFQIAVSAIGPIACIPTHWRELHAPHIPASEAKEL